MNILRSSLLLLLLLAAAPLHAAYKPENVQLPKNSADKEALKQCVQTIKALPRATREAIFADQLGLCYMLNGEPAYDSRRWVRNKALYIGSDGKEHDFYQAVNQIGGHSWQRNVDIIEDLGRDNVFHSFTGDITKIISRTAAWHLKNMPPVLREAWLAEAGGLLFLPSGDKAYTGSTAKLELDSGTTVSFKGYDENAAFAASSGEVYLRANDSRLASDWHLWEERFNAVTLCAQLVGPKDVLSRFSKDLSTLRKVRAKLLADSEATASLESKLSEVKHVETREKKEYNDAPDRQGGSSHTLMGDTTLENQSM